MIKQIFKSLSLVLITTYVALFGYTKIIDPAYIVDQINPQKDEIIKELENKDFEKIFLKAGNDKFGFNHILKRHSTDYFADLSKKGILFPKGTSGNQIIEGIETVLNDGEADPSGYGNKKVLKHKMILNGEEASYRLVLNESNEIITFYKLKET